jgi:uncharacterized lipoprotein YmbA
MSIRPESRIPVVALAIVISVLSGCGSSEPARAIYVLGRGVSIEQNELSQLNSPVVEFRPVRIPDYLDNKDIVARQAGGQIVASRSARWGERLSVGVTRAATTSLAARLPRLAVVSTPSEIARWRVMIDIDAFEMQSAAQCVLAGRWSIWTGNGEKKLHDQKFSMNVPVDKGTDAEIVAAMNQLVDRLTADVAASLLDGVEPRRVTSY